MTTVEKHSTRREATLHVVMGDRHVRRHVYLRDGYAVTVMLTSRDEHALEQVLNSLR